MPMQRFSRRTDPIDAIQVRPDTLVEIATLLNVKVWANLLNPQEVRVDVTEPDGSTFHLNLNDWLITAPTGRRQADDAIFTQRYQLETGPGGQR